MKKVILLGTVVIALFSCADNNANESGTKTETNPSAIDSKTQHPNGVTNGSVMSTDTGAMNLNNKKPYNKYSSLKN
jgi:hypothetical protein